MDDRNLQKILQPIPRYHSRHGRDRAVENGAGAGISFRDNKKVSAHAVETIKWATSTGLISGKSNSKLDSRGYVTRAEFAAVLERFSNM